jgi:hypothetical protein
MSSRIAARLNPPSSTTALNTDNRRALAEIIDKIIAKWLQA